MDLTRRAALGLLAGGGIGAARGGYRLAWAEGGAPARPLAIPPLDSGAMREGARNFDLRLGQHASRFFEGVETPTYGINGNYLGPTLRMRAGERVRMNVRNGIGRPSTLHWHGMHLPARADGGPHQVIANGALWQAEFEVRQRAATLWYHSHMVPETGFQVYHGLAGLIVVDDQEAETLDLPSDYGVDDIPLVLQDRRFGSDGAFVYLSTMHDRMMGMTGDTLLVNGTVSPYFVARGDSLRLRVLNGSNARFYALAFGDGRRFHQIGSDGGLLAEPLETDRIILAPAERAEIVVDLGDGMPVTLMGATPPQSEMMGRGMMGMMIDGGYSFDVLDIRPDQTRRRAAGLPHRLATLPRPDPAAAVRTRRFTLGMGMGRGMMMNGGAMTINGRAMDMNRVDEVVRRGTQEIWQIDNPTMLSHPFHIHDVQFRVLDRNGAAPAPGERGLKDTVVVGAGERVRLLLGFADYADPDLPYMYHCHILEHEDAGMMGQFTVVS